jgi:polar amino acid transport system substrate-binding protein
LAIGACGGSNSSTSTPAGTAGAAATPAVDPAAAAKVPAAVKSKGKLTIAADATYAPNEFIGSDGHTVQGMDADLAHALGGVLGLKANVVNATFDSIIPGLVSHKFDLGMSSMTDTKAREKTLDFVTYFSAGTSFYEKTNGPPVNGLPDLCGKTVAVEKGTTQAADATAQSAKCQGAKVSVLTFPDQNGANLALASGRAQVGMADSPVGAYQVKQSHGQFKLTGTPYGTAPYGIAIPKGNGMAPALQAAVTKLIKGGQYGAILRHWGIASGAIGTPVVNGATS